MRGIRSGELESGQVIVLFALALVVLLGVLALILDGGRVYTERRQAQNAADAAAMAGAAALDTTNLNVSNVVAAACTAAAGYGYGSGTGQCGIGGTVVNVWVPTIAADGRQLPGVLSAFEAPGYVQVQVTSTFHPFVAGVFGFQSFAAGALAVAVNIPSNGLPYALLVLDPTDCASFSINGGTILNVTGGVMVDSAAAKTSSPTCTSKNAATTTGGSSGNNQLNTTNGSNNVVGSGDAQGVTPPWNTGANLVVDPLSAHVPPFDSATDQYIDGPYSYGTILGQPGTPATPALWSDNGGKSFPDPLSPGVVWGGMNVTGNLVLAGGVYIMAGGGFNVSGGTVSAQGPVTFIYTDDPVCAPGCKAGDLPGSVSGTGSTTGQTTGGNGGSWGLLPDPVTGVGPLVAPTSGVPQYLDSILIYVDKTIGTCTGTGNTTLVVGGSGTFAFEQGSIIYAPCSTVKLYGNQGSQGGAVVAYQVSVNGGKSLNLLGPGQNGPGPSKSNLVQ